MFKLRTLDVWDTLLRRDCHPDCSKRYSATLLPLRYFPNVKREFIKPQKIFDLRCKIEGEIYASSQGGEYTLLEVLTKLVDSVVERETSKNLKKKIVDLLYNSEIEFELNHTHADPDIRDFCNQYPAQKTLFLSDFYMPKDVIKKIINHHRLEDFVDDGLVSCDVGLNKRSGQLFKYVYDSFSAVSPDFQFSDWVHIGDNEFADFKIPSKFGIRAVLYRPIKQCKVKEINDSRFDIKVLNSNVIAETLSKSEQKDNAAFESGVRATPLFLGYSLFILEQIRKENISQIYFFTREGEFFIKLWDVLTSVQNYLFNSKDNTRAKLLEVSRLATFSASLMTISTSEMMRMWNLYSTQSMFAMFKSLGLNPDKFDQVLNQCGIQLNEKIQYPWNDDRVKKLFADQTFLKIVRSKIISSREKLNSYLNFKSFRDENSKVAIVDIGWRGTIQDNICLLRPNVQIFGFYLGLSKFLNPQPVNGCKCAYMMNGNINEKHMELLNDVSILEMLCNSPNGSTLGYENVDDGVYAKRLIDEKENQAFYGYTCDFQAGVIAAVHTWLKYIDRYVVSSYSLKELAFEAWTQIVFDTPVKMLQTKQKLNHNEIFGLGGFVQQRPIKNKSLLGESNSIEISYPSLLQCMKAIYSRNDRLELISFIKNNQSGSLIRKSSNIGKIRKIFLLTLIRLGLIYKKFILGH